MLCTEALVVAAYKPGMTEADIMAIPKGSRPPPSDYLEGPYVDKHLKTFEDEGGSFLFTSDDIANPKYGSFNPNKFVISGKIRPEVQENRRRFSTGVGLGADPGSLVGKDIYMMNLDNPKVLMPTGNEGGVNSLWRPGGLTIPAACAKRCWTMYPSPTVTTSMCWMTTRDVVRIQ